MPFTFTREEFLNALDLEAFAALFPPLGYVKVPGTDGWHLEPETLTHAVTLPDHRDTDDRWRHSVLYAAEIYTFLTGRQLWWIPRTDREASYASLLVGLLLAIRVTIEAHEGDWNGGDVVDLLCDFFTVLGLDIDVDITDTVTETPGEPLLTVDCEEVLKRTLARQPSASPW